MKKIKRVEENWVEVKVWDPSHVYFINGLHYIPLAYIEEFTDYSRSRVRWLIREWRVDKNALIYITNMIFVRRDYIPALQMMYFAPDKFERQNFMIDIYYKKHELKK